MIDPVPEEGTPGYEMLVLVMKWWAFALAAQAVSNIAVFSNAPDTVCKIYIRTTGLFAAMGGIGLTYENFKFATALNNVRFGPCFRSFFGDFWADLARFDAE